MPSSRALALFFVLAYAWSWTFWGAMLGLGVPVRSSLGRVLYLVAVGGPLVSASVVIARLEGAPGLRRLLARATRWRFNVGWWLVAIGTVAATACSASWLAKASGERALSSEPMLHLPHGSFGAAVLTQTWIVIGEEYGWRGFALPRLAVHFGHAGAALVLGLLWAAWHLPLFVAAGTPQAGTSFLAYVFGITAWSLMMALLFFRTGGSVLSAMVFHLTGNLTAYTVSVPAQAERYEQGLWFVVCLIVIALLPAARFRWTPLRS